MADRVVFVGVALRAFERQAQPHRTDGVDAVDGLLDAVFFFVDTPFAVRQRIAVESSRQARFCGGPWQEVARQLLLGELVIG